MLLTALAALLQTTAPSTPAAAASLAPRDPAVARDGRVAVSAGGDLWVRRAAGGGDAWMRVTEGTSWDRQPAWSPDGAWLVFASDRSGNLDLWRLRVGASGAEGSPERLTTSPEPEAEPTVGADGRIVFVRGRGAAARLWLRAADGAERRVTNGTVAERWPALSADGARLAYVALGESGNRLRIRSMSAAADAGDSVAIADRAAERPAWSPAGDRLAFTVELPRPGVYVAPPDGRYANLVASRHASAAWSADGRQLVLAALAPGDVGYNGDPDRVGDREIGARAPGALWTIDAPAAPDAGLAAASTPPDDPATRTARNAEAFDRLWTRTATLYFPEGSARRARWDALRAEHRPRALAARDDAELGAALHALLRARPPYGESATGRAAVSSAHPVATAAGLEVLRKGGNVVDAAVAVSFALGVVEPDASGIGGYGQMLVYRPGMPEPALIEFMSRVPEEGSLDNGALLQGGRLPPDGPVLANVPGTVAAMHLAWRRHGSGAVPWAALLAPAIRAAREGFVVSDGLATTIATERAHLTKWPAARALFFRNGAPLRAGDTLRNPDLAWTLEQIAKDGADAFYRGEVARRIVADLRGQGNAMRLTDLARYYAAERAPVSGRYRGLTLYSSAPPVSGGATLVSQLALLEQAGRAAPYQEDAATLHAMLSAWQLVPSTRNRIADPGLWPVNLEPFVNRDTARARWRCFDPERALGPEVVRGETLACAGARRAATTPVGALRDAIDVAAEDAHAPCEPASAAALGRPCHAAGTTAFTVADGAGNVVAVTQTLGTWGGNFYVTPGLGFLYNDKLGSYGSDPAAYGARLPLARHGSTIAPTIVFEGEGSRRRPRFALGAAGNAWITSAVYQTLVGLVDQGLDPQRALELPRFLVAGRQPDARGVTVQVEDGFAPGVLARLRAMGYEIRPISLPGELRMGYGAALSIRDGRVTAGADPRRSGAAGAVPD